MRAAQLTRLLLSASLIVLRPALAQRKCYLPNGDLAPDDKPCLSTANHVFCCPTGYSCQGSPGPACSANDTLIRPSCTDSTFGSVNCPHYCIARQFADQADIKRCSTDLGGEMCCGYDARRDLCSCSPRNNTFSLGAYELVTMASATSSSTTKTQSPTKTRTLTTTSSASPTESAPAAPSTSSGLSVGARAGIGVAVPVVILGLAAIVVLAIMKRKRRAGEQKPSEEAEAPAYEKAELDAETTARKREELVKPSIELAGSTVKNQSPVELDSRMLPIEISSHRSPTTPN